jgi:hypothetical protein
MPDQNDQDEVKVSKVDDFFRKGMKSFFDSYQEPNNKSIHQTKAHGYLTMAYKAAGNDVEEKKGIAGAMALVLVSMDDYKNAEAWAKEEFAINPINVFAKVAWYWIELDKLVNHKGFVLPSDGSWGGLLTNLVTGGVDAGRVSSKKNTVHQAAVEAAKAIEHKARTDPEPEPYTWIIWSWFLIDIIENMWANNMKEPYLCNVLMNLPWSKFTNEAINDLEEAIEEIQVTAQGYASRLR